MLSSWDKIGTLNQLIQKYIHFTQHPNSCLSLEAGVSLKACAVSPEGEEGPEWTGIPPHLCRPPHRLHRREPEVYPVWALCFKKKKENLLCNCITNSLFLHPSKEPARKRPSCGRWDSKLHSLQHCFPSARAKGVQAVPAVEIRHSLLGPGGWVNVRKQSGF